jgi:anti-sigma factor RsiW
MITATCREVHNLLELFFDSELDSRQMRAVALHSATCPQCEEELRHLEHLQDIVAQTVNEQVDEIDLSRVWSGIEQRIPVRRISWGSRLRTWWGELEFGWGIPAFGAAATAAAFAAFTFAQSPVAKSFENALENQVSVHEITSDDHVALVSEADTLLLWVDHELTGDADDGGLTEAEPANFEAIE